MRLCTRQVSVAAVAGIALVATSQADAFVVMTPTSSVKSSISVPGGQSRQQQHQQLYASFFENMFSGNKKKVQVVEEPPKPRFDPVVIDPDYRVAAIFLGAGVLLDLIPYIQLTLGPLVTLLGLLFLVQTYRVRFCFDAENAFEVRVASGATALSKSIDIDALESSGENPVVGGENRWDCESFVNYDFFPNGPLPILVYFKETQTPSSTWNDGPGKLANDPEKIAAGLAKPGQVHFFPAVCNCEQLKAEFEKRECRKM